MNLSKFPAEHLETNNLLNLQNSTLVFQDILLSGDDIILQQTAKNSSLFYFDRCGVLLQRIYLFNIILHEVNKQTKIKLISLIKYLLGISFQRK